MCIEESLGKGREGAIGAVKEFSNKDFSVCWMEEREQQDSRTFPMGL